MSRRKSGGARVSKRRLPVRGDLRRMSARDYYAHERMTGNAVAEWRKHMDPRLWLKLDRCKPVTRAQAEEIEDAMHRAAVSQPDWPFSWPHVKFGFVRLPSSKRPGMVVEWVEVRRIPKAGMADGVVYTPNMRDTVSFGGRGGVVVYSKHAIEQLVDRVPWIRREGAIKYAPDIVRKLLADLPGSGAVEMGAHGPCLTVRSRRDGSALGFFPMVGADLGGRSVWVCKTFLKPGMRGLPEERNREAGE